MDAAELRELLIADRGGDMARLRIYRRLQKAVPPEHHQAWRELQDTVMRRIRLIEQITGCRAWDGA